MITPLDHVRFKPSRSERDLLAERIRPALDRMAEAENWLRMVRIHSGYQPRVQWEPEIAIVAGPHVRLHPVGLLPELIQAITEWEVLMPVRGRSTGAA